MKNPTKIFFYQIKIKLSDDRHILKVTDIAIKEINDANYSDIIQKCVDEDKFPKGNTSPREHEDFNVTLWDNGGKNVYVFHLAEFENTAFSDTGDAIYAPSNLYAPMKDYITDLTMYHKNKEENPYPIWASFVLDNEVPRSCFQYVFDKESSEQTPLHEHDNDTLFMPFYLNLVDTVNGLPNWVLENHGHNNSSLISKMGAFLKRLFRPSNIQASRKYREFIDIKPPEAARIPRPRGHLGPHELYKNAISIKIAD